MPTYTFIDSDTGIEEDIVMKISELDTYKTNNPKKSQVIRSAFNIVSGVAHGRNKPDDSFRDILRNIKKNNRRSTINVP